MNQLDIFNITSSSHHLSPGICEINLPTEPGPAGPSFFPGRFSPRYKQTNCKVDLGLVGSWSSKSPGKKQVTQHIFLYAGEQVALKDEHRKNAWVFRVLVFKTTNHFEYMMVELPFYGKSHIGHMNSSVGQGQRPAEKKRKDTYQHFCVTKTTCG